MNLSYDILGAQVLESQLQNTPLFYKSYIVNPNHTKRGGVPIIFPQFASVGSYKKHGWVRDSEWLLLKDEKDKNSHLLKFSLQLDPTNNWPYSAKLTYDVIQLKNTLRLILKIENTGSTSFSFTGGLHPYFYVPSVLKCCVEGLKSISFTDKYKETHSEGVLKFTTSEFERLYHENIPLKLKYDNVVLEIHQKGFDEWMIWNPGQTLAKSIPDLPNKDWEKFISIEPVIASRPKLLEPGAIFNGSLKINLIINQT
jgi:glucose-6-phosphate 1-epimerase